MTFTGAPIKKILLEDYKLNEHNLVIKTIYECLKEQVNKAHHHIALEYDDEIFSWKDIDAISDYVAVVYMRMGIKKGSHVGIWSTNTPNWIFTFFALIKLGAIPILLNSCYKEMELFKMLHYADVEYLCYGDGYDERKYEDVLIKLNETKLISKENCISIGQPEDGKWNGLKEIYEKPNEEELKSLRIFSKEVSVFDTAAMLFTSGTSKMPKGVMLSHYSLVNNSLEIARSMQWTDEDKMCIAVPMYHCFGVTASLLASVHVGCSMYLLHYYRTIYIIKKIHKYKCTILNGVPTMFLAMVYNKKLADYDLSSIKSGIIAGSRISANEYQKICDVFQFTHLQTSYGQTETSPCITISVPDDSLEKKASSAGKKIANVELRIFDEKTKEECQIGEIGEIQAKGYNVMQRYYKMPEETKATILEDGWLCTGDLGYLNEDGYLYITGRKTEMIIRGGENISPSEIEAIISVYPNVKNVKVIGVEADVLQEEIVACIISANNIEIDKDGLVEYLKGKLSDYKVPKYILQFDMLPLNGSGKVILKDLKEQALERINLINKEEQQCILQSNMS